MRSPIRAVTRLLSLSLFSLIALQAQSAKFASSTATTTTVASSQGTITLGDTVTFTATVTAASGTPTGLVTFFDDTTPLGSGALTVVAGQDQTSFSTALLSAAGSPHSITAVYQGDGAHTGSTSPAISETVDRRHEGSIVLASSPTNVVVGQSSTVTVTATDSGSVPPGAADTFSPTGAPATGRTGFAANVFADGLVLIAGGTDANNNALQSAEIYSISGGNFVATGNLFQARTGAASVLLPTGKVLIAGGSSNGLASGASSGALSSAELFDPSAGTFSFTGSMSTGRFGATATLLNTGKVLVAGGENVGGVLSSAELYDPTSNTFTVSSGSLNTARTGHSATLLGTGKVLIAGGSSNGTPFGALSSAEVFDPAANGGAGAFTAITGLNSILDNPRWQPEAALLLNGRVLIAGGVEFFGSNTTADIYDPVANTFTVSNHGLSVGRAGGSAVALPNGMVLLAGGTSATAVDLYDPDSDLFDSTGNLQQSDNGLVSTLLNNGQVLVVGLTNAATPVSDAELYSPSFNPLGTVGLSSSEPTDFFGNGCPLVPSSTTASTCTATVTPFNVATSPHTITGTYSADAVHFPSSSTASLTVAKDNTTPSITAHTPNPSVVGQSVTITVTVTPNGPGSGTPTGTVTVSDGAGETCTITLSAGSGSCSLTPVLAGSDTLTAGYNGDANFNGSGAAGVTQTVSQGSVSVMVGSSLNPSAFGQSVTFTATVPAASPATGTPTGSVTFTVPGSSPATVPLQNNGGPNLTALFTTSALPVGDDTISAGYNGNSNFNSGLGTLAGGQIVLAPPAISKAFNSPTIELGAKSTLSITISNPNTLALTGVAFSDLLPPGMAIVAPEWNNCGFTVTSNSIGATNNTLAANASCTDSWLVSAGPAGTYTNTTSPITSSNGGNGNSATATLTVVTGSLGGSFGARTGALNARQWTVNIGNGTSGTAIGAEVDSLTLTQTFGTSCTPSITSSLPAPAGNIPSHGTGFANVMIDFSSCTGRVFFKAVANVSADGHTVTGVITAQNQLP